jgi:SsrA-binding protein
MSVKVLVTNRKAYHDYNIGDKFEAGIVLQGTEVKSLRASKANLMDGWIDISDGQATLCDISISQYSYGNIMNHEEKRPRRLLLSKLEIIRLQEKIHEKGFTIIPLKIYFKGRYIKVEVALAKGKKLYDKRESEKKKQANRDIERALRSRGD